MSIRVPIHFFENYYRFFFVKKPIIKLLLHSPGTLLSPWNNKLYTPIYFYIETNGNIFVPVEENLTIDFLTPEEILNKDNIANPEKKAVKNLLKLNII